MDTKDRDNSRKSPAQKKTFRKVFLILVVVFAVMIAGIGLGFLTASLNTKPDLANDIRPPASSQIYDINENLITTIHSVENRVPIPLSKIPKNLQNAFVAVEDARFYQHMGVDPRGIIRAVWANITNRGVSEGGSTITQQLAKNAYLSQERTLKRKIQEVFLALQLERQYTKNEILELYINQIYFGQGAYGVQAAAQLYFGKNAEDLTLAECAMLAGIPKSPNYYSPLNNFKASNLRKETVLDQMEKYNYISSMTASKARREEIKLVKHNSKEETKVAPYFIDYVTQQLIDKYGADAVYKEGLKIYTTIDLDMQRAAEDAMTQLPTYHTDDNGIVQPQGALVAIDPHTGYIKSMVGGRGNDQFNRATMAERQPGSAFKPFVYLAALESKMSTTTIIDDSKFALDGWEPQNYDRRFRGKVSMRTALEHSLNIPAIKVAQQVGIDKVLYYAQETGISTLVMDGARNDRNLSSALGGLTKGVTPLELASAYGTFANLGIHVQPKAIVKIIDRNGKILEQAALQEKQVVSAKTAYVLTDMLKGVIARGSGAGANIGRAAAGKTGTTSNYVDAWFVGYTPDLVAAVWMGNDSNGELRGITGADTPADIWASFMKKALNGTSAKDFYKPDGVSLDTAPAVDNSEATPVKKEEPTKKEAADPKDAKTKPTDKDKAPASEKPVKDTTPQAPAAEPAPVEQQPVVPPPAAPQVPPAPPAPVPDKRP